MADLLFEHARLSQARSAWPLPGSTEPGKADRTVSTHLVSPPKKQTKLRECLRKYIVNLLVVVFDSHPARSSGARRAGLVACGDKGR